MLLGVSEELPYLETTLVVCKPAGFEIFRCFVAASIVRDRKREYDYPAASQGE
jgi:hypothetical protein